MKFLNEIRMGGNKITGLSEPTQNDEVANKEYADGLIKAQATKQDIVKLLLDYNKYESNENDFVVHETVDIPEMGTVSVAVLAQEMGYAGIDKLMTYEGDKDKYIIIPDEIYKEGLLMTFMP